MSDAPKILSVKRSGGIAGLVQYNASVQYPDEEPQVTGFVGSPGESGGPVVMIFGETEHQVFVTDPGRHGAFGPEWVRRFYAERS